MMGEYIKDKKKMIFASIDSLKNVQNVLKEAGLAVEDTNRKIDDSSMSEVLAGVLGMSGGGAISAAALYFGGSVVGLSAAGITSGLAAAGSLVGGGMVAGIGVLAAPIAILGAAGVGIASHIKSKKLREAKELCYKEALAKQNAILKALREETNADKKRIELLTGLNTLLKEAIRELEYDLGKN